jgi:hypothetical protein
MGFPFSCRVYVLLSCPRQAWRHKAERVGPSRWFQYNRAVRHFGRIWTARYIGMLYLCLSLDMFTQHAPCKAVASRLAEGQGEQASKERTGQESSEISQIRRAAKNTLEFQCTVLSDYELKDANRLIAYMLQPFDDAHSLQNRTCRSRAANLHWYWEQSCGRAFDPILECAKLFSDPAAQEEVGILFTPALRAQLVGLAVDSPLVVVQSSKAHTLGVFTIHLLWRYMTAAAWHLWSVPGIFARLTKEDTAGPALEFMKKAHAAWKVVQQKRGNTWASWKKRSIFQDAFCLKVFALAEEAQWEWTPDLASEMSKCFGGCTGTKATEDGLRLARQEESLKSGWNKQVATERVWKSLVSSGLLDAVHKYKSIEFHGEQVDPRVCTARARRKLFSPSPRTSPAWLREVMGPTRQPPWYSTAALNDTVHWVDLHCMCSYLETDRWEYASSLWLSLLLSGDCLLATHASLGQQLFFVLGHVSGRVVLGWPAKPFPGPGECYCLRTHAPVVIIVGAIPVGH